MEFYKNLISKYAGLSTVFKSFFLLLTLFLLFFGISLFINVKNKPYSAYDSLINKTNKTNEKQNLMLQDTRVHNWDELGKK